MAVVALDINNLLQPIISGNLVFKSNTGFVLTLDHDATAARTVTIPDASDTLCLLAASQALSGKTYNGLTLVAAAIGFTIAGGTTSKTLTISNTLTLAATDGSTLTIGAGGTLGTAAYTASTAYEASGAISTHAALTTGVHGLAITAGQTLTVTTGGTLGSNAYTSTAYAPLASPTFTGTVALPLAVFSGADSISRNVDNSQLDIYGGTEGNSAWIRLFGKTHATTPGWLDLITPNASLAATLRVRLSGGVDTAVATCGNLYWVGMKFGLVGTATGAFTIDGVTSGVVTMTVAAAAGTWIMTLPTSAGTSGYVLSTDGSGVTSWISLTGYAPLASPTFTGTVVIPSPFTLGATSVTASGAEMNYLVGVTSAIQTQLAAKASILAVGAGDTLNLSSDASKSEPSQTYTLMKEIKQHFASGTLRIKFSISSSDGVNPVYSKIYRNGVAVGTERSTTSGTATEFSEDLAGWSADDLIQIYGHGFNGNQNCQLTNFRIYSDATAEGRVTLA